MEIQTFISQTKRIVTVLGVAPVLCLYFGLLIEESLEMELSSLFHFTFYHNYLSLFAESMILSGKCLAIVVLGSVLFATPALLLKLIEKGEEELELRKLKRTESYLSLYPPRLRVISKEEVQKHLLGE